LKRRKKPGEGTPKEAAKAPEPLQPRFYDDEPATPADAAAVAPVVVPAEVVPVALTPVREARRMSRAEPELASEPSPVAAEAAAAGETRPRTSRRRRSRGGRGGNHGRTAGSPAPAAIAAEPSATE